MRASFSWGVVLGSGEERMGRAKTKQREHLIDVAEVQDVADPDRLQYRQQLGGVMFLEQRR